MALLEGVVKKYVSIQEAAEMLSCSPKTIRRMIARGDLPAYSLGKRGPNNQHPNLRIRVEDIDKAMHRVNTIRPEEYR